MSDVQWFACLADVTGYLGPRAAVLALDWDDSRALLRIRAPIDACVEGIPKPELAVALTRINFALPMLLLELDDRLAFTTHLFFDEDGRVSSTGLDACLLAISACETLAKHVFEEETRLGPNRHY